MFAHTEPYNEINNEQKQRQQQQQQQKHLHTKESFFSERVERRTNEKANQRKKDEWTDKNMLRPERSEALGEGEVA